MAVLLGVLVAATFGSGDFLGGRASRRAPTLTVLMVAQVAAVAGALAICVFVGAHVEARDIGFGALAGCVNIVGLGMLYQGLAVGPMGVVAPMTAVVASIVPVAWSVANGERPSTVVIVGAVLALGAAGLIAYETSEVRSARAPAAGALWSLGAGAFFGTSLIFYVQTSSASGLWPVLAARVVAFVLVGIVLAGVAMRATALPFPSGPDRTLALGAGFLDAAAAAFLLLAVRQGLMVVVAPISALSPAATVILARAVLGERLHPLQRVGLVLALGGLVLVALG
jgi:drug/metabolite transporter (DMT)-like permease